ncbi:unnamed protein product [Clonostachys rhizophaga]|uniref:Xylanolytic transcriptional activator regulatory domain-containing protein n=1 Tax=Clonostachys rhizophaga TaxID=160324 RepID=A0A9N9UWT3_9HYPO|nr:unnamed protein product [Clonostachys rhizophaga]
MTSVQACVLHGGYLVGTSAHDVAYNMHGLAVRMAINMGMHRSVSSDMLHPLVLELRNRLWWSVYTRDRLFTFQMGRPLTIEDDEIDTPYPTHVAELVVDRFGSPVDNQVALIDLCKLLGKLWLNPLQLPSHQHQPVSGAQPNKLEFLTTAAKCCVAAAITTIKILKFLRESKLMCRYACQDSLYCSAALHVLLLGARLGPPTDGFKAIIADGIYMLRELAEGNETAASAIEGITTGFNRLFKTQMLQPSPASTNPRDPADYRTMGSRAWEKWMAESSATATSSDRVYTGRPLDRDASDTSPSTGNAFSTYLLRNFPWLLLEIIQSPISRCGFQNWTKASAFLTEAWVKAQ